MIAVALDSGYEDGGRSYVPFKSGRKMPAYVDAYPDGRRGVLVSFRMEEKPAEKVSEKGIGTGEGTGTGKGAEKTEKQAGT